MGTSSRKLLSLSIEYADRHELIEALRKVANQVRNGKIRYNREMENTAIYEWSITNTEPPEYREEYINGQWCHVYQSKMNTHIPKEKHRTK